MATAQNMTEHINYIKILAQHLSEIDHEIAQKDLVIILISSLPEEYIHLITALETAADGHLTWGYVRDRVRHENEKLLKTANGNSNNALFSRKNGQNDDDKKSNKSDKKCYYRKKPGHFVRDCYKKRADLNKKEQHTGNFVCSDLRNAEKPEIALKPTNPVLRDTEWWIDSKYSPHDT